LEPETLTTIYILCKQGTTTLDIRTFFKQFIRVFFPINILDCIRKLIPNTMTEVSNKDTKKCGSKGKVMLTYGIIQLGTGLVSAISLGAIALSFCSIKKEAKVFNECVTEVQAKGKSISSAVHFFNGGT